MDATFDPTQFHPTFLGDDQHTLPTGTFHKYTMDSFLQSAHEYGLPSDVIGSAVISAYDFFGLVPSPVVEGAGTFVSLGNPATLSDDVMCIDRNGLMNLGIHDKDTLSLVATHEIAHQLTQLMYAQGQISPWQSELISDKWMGFRAAAEGLDIEKVIHTFEGLDDCDSHPGQDLRERHVRQAYETYNEYSRNGVDLNFNVLMDAAMTQIDADADVRSREVLARQNAMADGGNIMAYSWTKSEIDSHIKEAQDKIDFYKSVIRENEKIKADRISHGLPHALNDSNISGAKFELEKARKNLENWKNTKPSKS